MLHEGQPRDEGELRLGTMRRVDEAQPLPHASGHVTRPEPLIIGVPRETYSGEARVALVSSVLARLRKKGLEIVLDTGAGQAAGFPDATFAEQGVRIVPARAEVFAAADLPLTRGGEVVHPRVREACGLPPRAAAPEV